MIETKSKPDIDLDVLLFSGPDEVDIDRAKDVLGTTEPILAINSKNIPWSSVDMFELKADDFIPSLAMSFIDEEDVFTGDLAITNGDIVSFYVKSTKKTLKPIRIDFYITKSTPLSFKDPSGELRVEFTIKGIIHIPELWKEFSDSFPGSSYKTLQTIADELDLGFASNIDNTKDGEDMKWISPFQTYKEFIKEVTNFSYINDDSFQTSFIDFYYNLNFVEVNREIRPPEKFEEFVEAYFSFEGEENDAPLIVSNMDISGENAFNFSGNRIVDESGEISLLEGYGKVLQFYDGKRQSQNVEPLLQDSGDGFIMRGRLDSFYADELKRHKFRGIQTPNVHKNFKYAEFLNYVNNKELKKLKLEIDLDAVNLNFYKYQNIPVLFLRSFDSDTGENLDLNKFLSGNFLILDIKFWKDENRLRQTLVLGRREWPWPDKKITF